MNGLPSKEELQAMQARQNQLANAQALAAMGGEPGMNSTEAIAARDTADYLASGRPTQVANAAQSCAKINPALAQYLTAKDAENAAMAVPGATVQGSIAQPMQRDLAAEAQWGANKVTTPPNPELAKWAAALATGKAN